jgi:hypothetical protein
VPTVAPFARAESLGVPSLWAENCRALCNALVARGMFRTGAKTYTDAWQDLISCQRLGRLIARGGTLSELLLGLSVDSICGRAEMAFLEASHPSADQIDSCLRDLENLPPLTEIASKIDLAERCIFIDTVMRIDREGLSHYQLPASREATQGNHPLDSLLNGIEWDPALRSANRWYDRLVKATNDKNRQARNEEFEQIHADLAQLKVHFFEAGGLDRLRTCEPAERGQSLGDLFVAVLLPAVGKCQNALEYVRQRHENVLVAFRLNRYARDHGGFPKRLEDLVPGNMSRVPQDFFSGKPLIYRRTKDGYLLYSVGVNGIDEDGHGPQDDPPGDDLVVQMPLGKPLRR